MTFHYREIISEDSHSLLCLRASTRENAIPLDILEEEYNVTPESVSEGLNSDLKGWLCEDESGKIVGFSIGNKSNGEVSVVAIAPNYENLGIGKTLLNLVTEWLFSKGFESVWLGANPDSSLRSYGFYRKLGWQPTGDMVGNDEVLRLNK